MLLILRLLILGCLFLMSTNSFSQVIPPPKNAEELEHTQVLDELEITPSCRQIIGYYCSWQWYDRGSLLSPEQIDYSRYTILNYSFFQPDSLGNIYGTDDWADSVLLRGRYDWSSAVQPAYIPHTSVIDLAHVWGVKVMLSIGGWGASNNFPALAASAEGRAHFAGECVRLLKNFQFDGIDIDWEYPGYAEHKGSSADKKNFTSLMQAIRDSIDAYGQKTKTKFLLTAAFGANESNIENIEYEKLVPVVDYFNMMTYDINGAWSEIVSHHSSLYPAAQGYKGSLDHTFQLLTKEHHVPSSKINLGAAFYGRTVTFKATKPELYAVNTTKTSDDRTFPEDEGFPMYYNILARKEKHHFVEHWDSVAQAPYMISESTGSFITYDNPLSIQLKAEYVIKNDAAGVIIWDLSGDYIEKKIGSGKIADTPLADKLVEVLHPCRKKVIKKRWR